MGYCSSPYLGNLSRITTNPHPSVSNIACCGHGSSLYLELILGLRHLHIRTDEIIRSPLSEDNKDLLTKKLSLSHPFFFWGQACNVVDNGIILILYLHYTMFVWKKQDDGWLDQAL